MVIKFNLKKFLISVGIPLVTGGLAALLTKDGMDLYSQINVPPLSPPGWLFPVAWTVLYLLMGTSLYLIWNNGTDYNFQKVAFILFAVQLILNFSWSLVFFNSRQFVAAFVILIFMFIFTVFMTLQFYKINKTSAFLQIPYLLWLAFAGYLNYAICVLN